MATARLPRLAAVVAAALLPGLAGCGANTPLPSDTPQLERATPTAKRLRTLPAPPNPVPVAVYGFPDKTGQRKPTEEPYAASSMAVTQGGAAILIETLLETSRRDFFRVVERQNFNDVAQERQIIAKMRKRYGGGGQFRDLGPLTYAGLILAGGITMYETNLVSGGIGARYFGIGANTKYRRDAVTVHLRAVNVSSGEVVASVDASKTVYSTEYRADFLRFVVPNRTLEVEAGITSNEPRQLAVQQAIEQAVYGLAMEGAQHGLWRFADKKAGKQALKRYRKRLDREVVYDKADAAAAAESDPPRRKGAATGAP